MGLVLSVSDIIRGDIVESDRVEYKEGFDPLKLMHSICAFANDINNYGGGYILLGITAPKGIPDLHPKGLEKEQVDSYQRKIIEIQNKISPFVQVVCSPEKFNGKNILVVWVPGGESRPYEAPESNTRGARKQYFVRRHSTTVKANNLEKRRLIELSAKIPFDDRVNHSADITDISKDILREFLKEAKSGLFADSSKMSLEELCSSIQLIRGPKENIKPVNAGLLMFSENPEKYFPGARIEIVEFKDEIGDEFTEKIFKGPLFRQLKDALAYLKNSIIKEKVIKISGKAEAERYFNYPYGALEEVLANAVYHRGYDLRDPIEVSIFPNRIEVVSKPGPMPPITNKDLKKARLSVREYRNRRIGEFLKELHMTEGRGTGFPKINNALKANSSPHILYKTDKDRHSFLAIIKVQKELALGRRQVGTKSESGLVEGLVERLVENQLRLLWLMGSDPHVTKRNLSEKIGISTTAIDKNILVLKNKGLLNREGPDKGGYWVVPENIMKKVKNLIKK